MMLDVYSQNFLNSVNALLRDAKKQNINIDALIELVSDKINKNKVNFTEQEPQQPMRRAVAKVVKPREVSAPVRCPSNNCSGVLSAAFTYRFDNLLIVRCSKKCGYSEVVK